MGDKEGVAVDVGCVRALVAVGVLDLSKEGQASDERRKVPPIPTQTQKPVIFVEGRNRMASFGREFYVKLAGGCFVVRALRARAGGDAALPSCNVAPAQEADAPTRRRRRRPTDRPTDRPTRPR